MDKTNYLIIFICTFILLLYVNSEIVIEKLNMIIENNTTPQVTNYQPTNPVYNNKNLKFKFYENGCFDAKLPSGFILRCA